MADPTLERISDLLSRGEPVDWDRVESATGSDEEQRWIRNLHVVAEVGRLARLAPETADALATASLVGMAADPVGEAPLPEWGTLTPLALIGRGGFGEVYRAWDAALQRQVALKLLAPERQGQGRWLGTLQEEARLLARVEHPNVARVYGVETHNDRPGLWMELVEGTDLARLVEERGRLPQDEAIRITRDVLAGLSAVHDAGLVHQDVKPHNVMVRPDGRVVLMDFGAGGRRSGDADPRIAGTPTVMAPELFEGAPASPQSDCFAVGVLLYHLLTGDYPVKGRTVSEITEEHRSGRVTSLASARPDLPTGLAELVDTSLAADREQRPVTAAAFSNALADYASPATPGHPRSANSAGSPSPVARSTRRRWAGVAVALAVLTTLAIVLFPQGSGVSPLSAAVTLHRLDDAGPVPLEPGDPITYRDVLEIQVEVNAPSWIYILNLDAAGNAVLMYPPSGGDDSGPLPEGIHRLPGRIEGVRRGWTFSRDPGTERFLVVASRDALTGFETAVENADIPAISPQGVLTVRPAGRDALVALTRGVTGTTEVQSTDDGTRARQAAEGWVRELLEAARRSERVWAAETHLENPGAG